MKKEELIKQVAIILGVSASEEEFAFKLFLEQIAGSLEFNSALKIPDLGIFQLRRGEKPDLYSLIIFAPSAGIFDSVSKSLFLTFKVQVQEGKKDSEFDESVFSIGVGKPLVPLNAEPGEHGDLDASYVALKKSIEERIREVISQSLILTNFDLWEDYVNQLEEIPPEPEQDILEQMINEEEPPKPKEPAESQTPVSGFDALERDLESFRTMTEQELSEEIESGNRNHTDTFEQIGLTHVESDESADQETIGSSELNEFVANDSITSSDTPGNELNGEKHLKQDEKFSTIESDEKLWREFETKSNDELNNIENSLRATRELKETLVEQQNDQLSEESQNEKLGRSFWIIVGAISFVIIASVFYFLFIANPTRVNQKTAAEPAKQDTGFVPVKTEMQNENEVAPVKKENAPVKKDTPEGKPLYRKIENDRIVSGMIFTDGKLYSVQVSSWRRKETAEHETRRLRRLGQNAFIVEAYIPKKGGTWYRVRIGDFKSLSEAQNFLKNK